MTFVKRLAIVDPNDQTRSQIKAIVSHLDDLVWLEVECAEYESFFNVAKDHALNACIVALDTNPTKSLELIKKLRREVPTCNVLAVSQATDGQAILNAVRAGAKEFLSLPLKAEELVSSLQMLTESGDESREAAQRGTAYVFAGASGGVGQTSIAVNLATIMASNPSHTVAYVDLDLSIGDSDVLLDAMPEYTLGDVAENISRLDFDLLRRSFTKLESGLFLLPRPVDLADVSLVTAEAIRRVISMLKVSFTHIFIDASKAFNPLDLAAMESADQILLITQLSLPSMRNVVRLLRSFEHIEEISDKIKVIVNRVGLENTLIRLKKAEETIGKKIFWQLPNDYRLMVEVCNSGIPLVKHAPKAEMTQSLIRLARVLNGEQVEAVDAAPKPAAAAPAVSKFFGFLPSSTAK